MIGLKQEYKRSKLYDSQGKFIGRIGHVDRGSGFSKSLKPQAEKNYRLIYLEDGNQKKFSPQKKLPEVMSEG